jgi:hypothetical protein
MPPKISCYALTLITIFTLAACSKQASEQVASSEPVTAIGTGEEKTDAPVNIVQDFERCTIDSDCTLMNGPCGESQGVNKDKEKEFSHYLATVLVMCPENTQPMRASGVQCVETRCSAIIGDASEAVKSDFYACEQDNDCVVESGVCNNMEGVNKAHIKEFREQVAIQSQAVDCMSPDPNPPEFTALCMASRCEAVSSE